MSATPDVAIVGGGFAGLSAAVRLARHGARVLVLEARGRLGGRATAFADRQTGEQIDNGQHVLLGCYHETFRFLRSIGAQEGVRVAPCLDVPFIDRGGTRTRLRCPDLPSPLHLLAGVVDWPALSAGDRLAVMALAPSLWRARRWAQGARVDLPALFSRDETVEEWLVRHAQTPRVCEMLWEPLALAALNQDVRTAAAGPFVRVLGGVFGPDSRDASIALPAVPLDELYARPARQDLERRRGEIRVNALARVVLETGGPPAVEVRGERLEARAVIVAVPWYDLPSVFRGTTDPIADVLSAAAGTPASPIVTVNLWFDRPVLDAAFVGLPGRVMQWVFEKGAARGDGPFRLSLVSSGAADVFRRSGDDLVAIGVDEVREALPGARHAAVVRASVVREPNATFSLAPGSPARPATRTAVPGLFLAGDWVDTELPATIESAVVSGHWAAEAALACLGGGPGA
jgi:zeta-carotene desaturase